MLKGLSQLLPARVVSSRGLCRCVALLVVASFPCPVGLTGVTIFFPFLCLQLSCLQHTVLHGALCAMWRTCRVGFCRCVAQLGYLCVGRGACLDVAMVCAGSRQRAASLRVCVFICLCQQVFLLVADYSMHMGRGCTTGTLHCGVLHARVGVLAPQHASIMAGCEELSGDARQVSALYHVFGGMLVPGSTGCLAEVWQLCCTVGDHQGLAAPTRAVHVCWC